MYDPADGFITAAILLQERVRRGEWPDRLSYDSEEQLRDAQARTRPVADRPLSEESGFALGTPAERAQRARS